jgi:hypothetical protein
MAKLADLSPDAPPASVLRLARYLVRNVADYGALEVGDYVSIAVLRFYEVRDRWAGVGCFGSYVIRCMDGAIRDARRREARQHADYLPPKAGPSSKGSRAPVGSRTPESNTGGISASPTLDASTRRRISRQDHNRTYYYRTFGRQHCEGCGVLVERGHGARRCEACATPSQRKQRQYRERRARRRAAA